MTAKKGGKNPRGKESREGNWLRRADLNHRPSGYEPDELTGLLHSALCSGPEGDRTLDLRVANAALSQLSYEPVHRAFPL